MSELPEKVIVSNGCHDCIFSNQVRWCVLLMVDVLDYAEEDKRHPQCPLNTHSIKVVK